MPTLWLCPQATRHILDERLEMLIVDDNRRRRAEAGGNHGRERAANRSWRALVGSESTQTSTVVSIEQHRLNRSAKAVENPGMKTSLSHTKTARSRKLHRRLFRGTHPVPGISRPRISRPRREPPRCKDRKIDSNR